MSFGVADGMTAIVLANVLIGVPTSIATHRPNGLWFVLIVVLVYVGVLLFASARGTLPKEYWRHLVVHNRGEHLH